MEPGMFQAATVRQVAQPMAAAASTAPKLGGQLFLAGKPNFMETVITDDPPPAWMRARGTERWFRDAEAAEAAEAILFVASADLCPKPTSTPTASRRPAPSRSRVPGAARHGGARNGQAPWQPIQRDHR
jgi:hypothetical protein